MRIEISNKPIQEILADFEVILVVDKNLNHKFIKDKETLEFLNFKREGTCLLSKEKRLYIGIKALKFDEIRIALANAYKALKDLKISNFKIASYICGCKTKSFIAFAEGIFLGAYKFDKYKSNKKDESSLKEIFISTDEYSDTEFDINHAENGLRIGEIMANSANFAKNIINEIPEIYTPEKMAEDAEVLASDYAGLTCKVYDENFLVSQNMNAFLAVNRSSSHPPRLIHLIYKPEVEPKKRIIFVGKGLTYDSGGLSLKPSDYMLTMKSDKSGAAAAMAIVKGAAELELPFEIHAILGATENMIGGNSYKPDDVLISRSGVTIEVRNTDAEGRLVLADCLDFAQDLEPDILIDLATLTGACVVGLGEYTSGILGNNEELKKEFKKYAEESGEFYTILEFNDYLRDLIKSNIADISNSASSRYGGSITAGLFLDKFIRKEYKDKWMHLDIAGPAYLEKDWGYNSFGASGAGVRACLYYLFKIAKGEK